MTGLSTPPAAYVPDTAPGHTLETADHDEGLHETDRDAIRALFLEAWALRLPLTINGNMDHFQGVGGSGSAVPTTTYNTTTSYAADQMYVLPAGATLTSASRSTTVPDSKSRYSLAVVGAASVTTVDIGQRIESAVVNTRGKQSLVFSCYVRNESGASFTPNLRIGTPGSDDDFTTVTNRLDQALQLCADSAWTLVYHVFDPTAYTNIANGMDVALRVPSGSLVASDTVRVAQFDLRPGAALAPYLAPDPELERLRAARFFERLSFSASTIVSVLGFSSDTVGRGYFNWAIPKRAAPTLTFSTLADWAIRSPSYGADVTPATLASSGSTSAERSGISTTHGSSFGGHAAGSAGILRAVNATYIDVNARL